MISIRRTAIPIALSLGVALPAAAQDVIGRITGDLDGEPRDWMVYSFPQGAQSDYSGFGNIMDVTIFGQPEGAGPITTEDALVLSMTIFITNGTPSVESGEARYITEGMFKGYATGDPQPPSFELTNFEQGDGTLSLAGTVTGTMGATESPGLAPDYSDARDLSVAFEAVLTPPR